MGLPHLGSGRDPPLLVPLAVPTLRGPLGLSAATSLGSPGPSALDRLQVPGLGGVTVSPGTNRRKKGLGPLRGQCHGQGITEWKPSPAQRKFQGNGDFSPVYIRFFLKPILLPGTDLYFINLQFCKRGWKALRAVAGVPQLLLGHSLPHPFPPYRGWTSPAFPSSPGQGLTKPSPDLHEPLECALGTLTG